MKNAAPVLLGVMTLTASVARAQGPAPPPPMGPNVAGAQTDDDRRRQETLEALERSKEEDSGRGASFLYAYAGGGAGYLNLTGFSQSNSGLTQPSGCAGFAELGAGLNLFALTLGARARWNGAGGFNLWQVMADVGFHSPSKHWDRYIGVHGGYTFTGTVDKSGYPTIPLDDLSGPKMSGFVGGVDLGADYYLLPILSIGGAGTFDVFVLGRDAVKDASGVPVPDPTLGQGGSSVGYGITGAVRVGLHL